MGKTTREIHRQDARRIKDNERRLEDWKNRVPQLPPGVELTSTSTVKVRARLPPIDERTLPMTLTAEEAARVMRKPTLAAFYTAVQRGQVPGATKDGAKIKVDRDTLLKALRSGRGSR